MGDLFYQAREIIFSRLSQNAYVIFVGNAMSTALAIIFTVIVARFLGPEQWGLIAAFLSLAAILAAVGDFGLTSGLFRFISRIWVQNKEGAQKLLNELFSLRVITSFALSLALIIFALPLSKFVFKTDDLTLLITASIGNIFFLLIDFQIAAIQAKQNWKIASFLIALTNFLRVTLIILLFFYFGSLTILNTLFVFSISPFFSFLLSLVFQKEGFTIINLWNTFVRVAPFTSWMSVNRIFSAINSRIDALLLLQLTSPVEVGIFAAARQLSQGIPVILGSFATVLAPQFAELKGKVLRSAFNKSFGLSILISFMILLGVFLAGPVISLFGEKYERSVGVLGWLFVGLVPFALSTPFVNLLIYSLGRPKIIAMLSIIQLPVVVFGNIFLIPKIGIFSPVLILGAVNMATLVVTGTFALIHFGREK